LFETIYDWTSQTGKLQQISLKTAAVHLTTHTNTTTYSFKIIWTTTERL